MFIFEPVNLLLTEYHITTSRDRKYPFSLTTQVSKEKGGLFVLNFLEKDETLVDCRNEKIDKYFPRDGCRKQPDLIMIRGMSFKKNSVHCFIRDFRTQKLKKICGDLADK